MHILVALLSNSNWKMNETGFGCLSGVPPANARRIRGAFLDAPGASPDTPGASPEWFWLIPGLLLTELIVSWPKPHFDYSAVNF